MTEIEGRLADLIGDVVLSSTKHFDYTYISFRSGRILIVGNAGLTIRRNGIGPQVIGELR